MHRFVALAVVALIASQTAIGQSSSGSGPSSSTAGASASKSAGSAGSASAATGKSTASMARADLRMLTDLAEANMAEIETAKFALQKAQTEPAKTFAQKMIDDHTAALSKVQTLAQGKGVDLPKQPSLQHRTDIKALGTLSGNTFDVQYLKRAGVNDHQRTIQLLQKAQKQAKDADLKAMATEMLPTVQQHLQLAQQSSAQVVKK